jgi:hypothetical protein
MAIRAARPKAALGGTRRYVAGSAAKKENRETNVKLNSVAVLAGRN